MVEVKVAENIKGFAFYAAKDMKMAEDVDFVFMIWNGKSKGTLNNIINLTKQNKKVVVYLTPHKVFYVLKTMEEAWEPVSAYGADVTTLFNELDLGIYHKQKEVSIEQLSMF